jgi:hypothetical protein
VTQVSQGQKLSLKPLDFIGLSLPRMQYLEGDHIARIVDRPIHRGHASDTKQLLDLI